MANEIIIILLTYKFLKTDWFRQKMKMRPDRNGKLLQKKLEKVRGVDLDERCVSVFLAVQPAGKTGVTFGMYVPGI